MAEQNQKSWREQRKSIQPNTPETVYFHDTKPNYILINNNSPSPMFMGVSGLASAKTYDMIIPAFGTRLMPRMTGTDRIYLYIESKEAAPVQITSWEGEFNPASIPQSQEMVAAGGDGLLGMVDVNRIYDSLPAGNNLIGMVVVDKLNSPLPTGDNIIGKIVVNDFHTSLPQGENIIGGVKIAEPVTLAVGANKIGKVDIDSLPIQYGDYKKVTAAAAEEIVIKNELGYVYQIASDGVDVQLMDGTNEAWKKGDFQNNTPIRCLTSIKLKFAAAGTAYILYA